MRVDDLPQASEAARAGGETVIAGIAPRDANELAAWNFSLEIARAVANEIGTDGRLLRPDFAEHEPAILAHIAAINRGGFAAFYFNTVAMAYERARAGLPPILSL